MNEAVLTSPFGIVTAWLWLILSAAGVLLRVRRLIRLHRIVLPAPVNQADADYLAAVKRSTYLRLFVKCVFLMGALIAVFGATTLWPLWRIGIIAALAFMLSETLNVDLVRGRLGRSPVEAG